MLASVLERGKQVRYVFRIVVGGRMAPMSQNSGKKIPMMNITQWPLRIVSTPSVRRR